MKAGGNATRASAGASTERLRGFTLVELAIVMTIIGLIIGGIIKGQALANNARLTATVAQVQGFRAAHTTFMDVYSALPGDYRRAQGGIPGCTAANLCFNGNGDGVLGTVTANYSRDDQSALITLPAVETTMYWKHLVAANLMSGVRLDTDPEAPVWGATHPSSPNGGGFHVLTAAELPPNQAQGHYYILRLPITGDPHPVTQGITVMTPSEAFAIDTKMDDGRANTGGVRSDDAAAWCSSNTGEYNGSNAQSDCLMIFAME